MRGRACVLSPSSCGSSRAPDRVHPCSVGLLGKKNNSNYDSRPLAGVNSELFIITQRYYLFSKGFGLRGAVFRGFMLLLPLHHAGCDLAFYARPPALPAGAPSALKGTCVYTLPGPFGIWAPWGWWYRSLARPLLLSRPASARSVGRQVAYACSVCREWFHGRRARVRSLCLPPSLPSAASSASLRPRSLSWFAPILALSGCPIELKTINNVNAHSVRSRLRSLRSLVSKRL